LKQRWVLGLEYDGGGFAGWQQQSGRRTVQAALEQALSVVADQPVTAICAGRTDAGVHALEQVVHFDSEAQRPHHAWLLGGNSHLPEAVRILWVKPAIGDFHARYSAIARFYQYVILNRPIKSALARQQVTWHYAPLDAKKMHQAAQHLVGNHDFSSFRAQSCQSKSPRRMMHCIEVYRQSDRIIIDLCANAFLHHMVRNIAGVLLAIGAGKQPVNWTLALLEAKNRSLAAVTAPPDGLYLAGVFYPQRYGLSKHSLFNQLPPDAKRFD